MGHNPQEVSKPQSGPALTVGLASLTYPDVFTDTDGVILSLNETITPITSIHTYQVTSANTAVDTYEIMFRDIANNANSVSFSTSRDSIPPSISFPTLNLTNSVNAFLVGQTLYYGPNSSGNLTISANASDGQSGLNGVIFPGHFNTPPTNDETSPPPPHSRTKPASWSARAATCPSAKSAGLFVG